MDVDGRLGALRKRLNEAEASAAMVSLASNLRYLTAFDGVIDHGINGACLVTQDQARFYTDARYIDAALAASAGGPWEVILQKENLYIELCEQLQAESHTSLLLESDIPYGRFKFLSEQFRGGVRAVDTLVESGRQLKEAEEIERIARAAEIADSAFQYLLGIMKPGVTERDLALELEFMMRRNGSEEMPFDPIVASGPNAVRPHAIPGPRALEPGDLVVLDFGAKVGGYCSDMTRTVAIGKANDEQRRVYAAVLEANEAGLAAVRPGLPCAEVDKASRVVMQKHGLGEYFTHGVGHGVGLDIHEAPTLSPRSTQSLRRDMVVTVEPGAYVSGVAGVRIEDLVVVEESGCRILSHSPKELIEI